MGTRRAVREGIGWVRLLAILLQAARVEAIYVDEDQNISVRARIYSQAAIRIENSSVGTEPETKAGQLVQHRTFYNPEVDAILTSYTKWMQRPALGWLAPDDLRFRLAAWGFYDGLYDYGPDPFERNLRRLHFPPVLAPPAGPGRALIIEGSRLNLRMGGDTATLGDIFPGGDSRNARDIYGRRRRVNELYLSYSKGPLFFRVGRQSISWGEADTIALLDQNNPFDVTLGAPGVFQDLDESRIPLWTVRASLSVFDVLGPFSDGTIESYWVPGQVDTNTGIVPMLAASPYSPRGNDPQLNLPCSIGLCNQLRFVLFDHVPRRRFENSRWGVRMQTIVARTHTLSAWYYTHFPNAPVPRRAGVTSAAVNGFPLLVTEIVHDLTSVAGIADSFFFEPLDGIIRAEIEYFDNEPAFIPETNFGALDDFFATGTVPKADYWRGELGFDRFFFLRALNPTNSFTLISSIVGQYNADETDKKDFRFQGQLKPSYFRRPQGSAPREDDFVQIDRLEAFLQLTLQTDYMHGRLTPRSILLLHTRGTYAVIPSAEYRFTDSLLFAMSLVHIGGAYQGFGFFRDRDQIAFRVTYQLN